MSSWMFLKKNLVPYGKGFKYQVIDKLKRKENVKMHIV